MRHFRRVSVALGATALAAAMSAPAIAQVEEELLSGPKSRDQVVMELEQAHADGSLQKIHSEQGYQPDFDEARGDDVQYSNTQSDADVSVSMDGSNELQFDAPAAGGKSRAQVIDELRQAREDGSLEMMWGEPSRAPEFEAARSMNP